MSLSSLPTIIDSKIKVQNFSKKGYNSYLLTLNVSGYFIFICIYTLKKKKKFGLFGNPVLVKYWTEHMLGYFDPAFCFIH